MGFFHKQSWEYVLVLVWNVHQQYNFDYNGLDGILPVIGRVTL